MKNLQASLAPLRDRRYLVVLLIGFASGFPFVLHGSVLTLWLKSEGLSRSAIGLIGGVTAVYAVNWLWAPLIDRVRVPLLSRWYGQRRSWLLLCQGLLVLLLLAMSEGDPKNSLGLLSLCALGIATVSATQDIAIDSYRILLFRQDEFDSKMPFASALATTGWWAGYGFIGGALALTLGGDTIGLSWPMVYRVLALVVLVTMVLIALLPEVEAAHVPEPLVRRTPLQWLQQIAVAPFVEFFKRCGLQLGLAILLFLFSFRIGEAMLGRMSLVFYVELGFTTEQIAFYNKFLGGLSTVVFSLMGAMINTRYGVIRGMLVGGIAMASANLLYAVMSIMGPVPWLFMVTLLIDNFCGAFATVAVVSFISYFTSRTFTGTQFSLMVALSNFGRTTLAAGSGVVVDALGGNWPLFFIFTTVAVIPALCLLLWMGKLLDRFHAAQ
jgi:PAT family beta-lactamase induction signal transducer AmpG